MLLLHSIMPVLLRIYCTHTYKMEKSLFLEQCILCSLRVLLFIKTGKMAYYSRILIMSCFLAGLPYRESSDFVQLHVHVSLTYIDQLSTTTCMCTIYMCVLVVCLRNCIYIHVVKEQCDLTLWRIRKNTVKTKC